MATPTSSSTRSKRKASKPVTADKGRTNRARVSTAKTTSSDTRSSNSGARVTNASQRTSTGTTKVSSSTRPALPARSSATDLQRLQTAARTKPTRPAPKVNIKPPAKPALPPGQKGGQLVSAGTRQSRAQAKANTAAQGTTGPNRVGRSDARLALPPGRTGGAITRSGSGALSRVSSAAASAARNVSKAGRALTGLKGGIAGAALAMGGSAAIEAGVGAYKQAIRKERGERAGQSGQSGRYIPGGQQSRGGMGGVSNIPPGEGPRNNPSVGKPAPKPVPRPSASRPSQSTPSRSTASGGGSSQRSAAPQTTKPAMPGRKFEDFNPGRGTSKSNNPLLDRDSGGMKLRDRMKQREASAQGEKAKNLSSNFGQDSGYESKTKVDGSKFADKKPDMKNVSEYDRRKKRYYS